MITACATNDASSAAADAGSGTNSARSAIDAEAAAPGSLDDSAIEATAIGYATFTKINAHPYPTRQHLGNPLVNVYANAIALNTYASLDFGVAPDGRVSFPPGSMLVKAMFDDDAGAPDVLTVMYKKSPGYDSAHDDWWYGRLDATSGTPTDPTYAGQVDFCIGCHIGTAASDYAWGVASSDK
jgi:hypothetical protein